MKDLTETVISIALALTVLALAYTFYGAQLASVVAKAFDAVPK